MRLLVLDNQKRYIVFENKDHDNISANENNIDMQKIHYKRFIPTHFVAIKLDWIDRKKSEKEYIEFIHSDKNLPKGLFTQFERLHLTITTLVLDSKDKVELACSILQSITKAFIDTEFFLSSDAPLPSKMPKISVRGLQIMKGTSNHCQVLYAQVHTKHINSLLSFCEFIKFSFQQAGLSTDDHSPIQLHCTVMNTRYIINSKDRFEKRFLNRQNHAFDATRIMDQGIDLGNAHISLLHLSPLSSINTDEYYKCNVSLYISMSKHNNSESE